ncbi:DUF6338 family protein [Nonomuraea insulae]|uniref:DUF6338 family protein n=1 Tax=Nonomuraea insulae TaxID=1616787 RepID=A0ABW1DAK4_9ACTN
MPFPATFIGLLLFVILLMPGFAHSVIRDRNRAKPPLSPVREVIGIAYVSVLADGAALLFFTLLRIMWPTGTPDIGALVRDPDGYTRVHYASLGWWSLAVLALAVILASISASTGLRRISDRSAVLRRIVPSAQHDSAASAWVLLFNQYPDMRVHIGCFLDDDSYVAGWLMSFNWSVEESADRELVLTDPITYRPPKGTTETVLSGVGAVSVSARRINLLMVSYLPAEENQAPAEKDANKPQADDESP